jgi:hypothetical protein
MPTPQRLPIVNSDDGIWGDILRQYLMKEHYDDGTSNAVNGGHQKITVRAGTATAGTAPIKLTSGTLMTAAEAGAIEFDNDSLYFTITTGDTRKKVALYDDSVGATGDLYYRNSSGIFTRLPAGADGKTLRVVSGVPTWDEASASVATSTHTSNYVIDGTSIIIFADATAADVTIVLPAAASFAGYRFEIKRIDGSSNGCFIAAISGLIDGLNSIHLDLQYTSIGAVSNGSDWYIL